MSDQTENTSDGEDIAREDANSKEAERLSDTGSVPATEEAAKDDNQPRSVIDEINTLMDQAISRRGGRCLLWFLAGVGLLSLALVGFFFLMEVVGKSDRNASRTPAAALADIAEPTITGTAILPTVARAATLTMTVTPTWTATPTHDQPTRTLSATSTLTPTATRTSENASTGTQAETPAIAVTPTSLAVHTLISEKDGMMMVYVPAGEFLMGSGETDESAYGDEKPQHTVFLDAYWIDQTEVTNGMYQQCVTAGACLVPDGFISSSRSSYYGNATYQDFPVIEVDWYQAQAYCMWAGRRLPTEAEWEKAARGTDGRTYPWGETIDCTRINYNTCVGDTVMVGNYPAAASPYGALDMAGNVWEWVADWYGAPYSSTPETNPSGPDLGKYRVIRGGSWFNDEGLVRTTVRDKGDLNMAALDVGFRCALSADS